MSNELPGPFRATLGRDLLLSVRRSGDIANPIIFFVIVAALFPLGIGPSPKNLAMIAPGVVWVVALLASLLSTDLMFRGDFDDGSLEQLVRAPASLYATALAKVLVHWIVTGLPLSLMAPLVGELLYLPNSATVPLILAMLPGTLFLSMVGGIGAALTVALRKGGILLSLLILPLYVPVLVFGTATVDAAAANLAYDVPLAVLIALALLSLTLAPLAIGAALRISIDH